MDALEEQMDREISIHALREEGDNFRRNPIPEIFYFYPRPPRGGRPLMPRRSITP